MEEVEIFVDLLSEVIQDMEAWMMLPNFLNFVNSEIAKILDLS